MMQAQINTLPSSWRIAQIRAFSQNLQPGFARQPNDSEKGILQLRMPSISRSGYIDFTISKFVDATDAERSKYAVLRGDVIFNNTNSPELVGNAAVYDHHIEAVLSNHMTRIRVDERVIQPGFLAAVLHRYWLTGQTQRRSKQWINQAAIDVENLASFRIPLPPLSEQQRIVDILQEAEEIRRLRAEAEAKTAELIPAMFYDHFVGGQEHDFLPLYKVAEIVSGVAIGRKMKGLTAEVPYLRVANVQAGFVDLSEIKTTPASDEEVLQFGLKHGDVLLTEGGDFDKLGRGCLWEGQVEPCIHQNHVFRVRPIPGKLNSHFFTHYLQSARAKNYFLRCAKKTTNLASINLTQLKALPVPSISIEDQERFEVQIQTAGECTAVSANKTFMALTRSLSAHAFSGQLTADWRESHRERLSIEARERDAALKEAGAASSMVHAAVCRAVLARRPGYIEEFANPNVPALE